MNKHEVEWAAWDYYQNLDSHHIAEKKHCNNHTNAFEAGVEWAEKSIQLYVRSLTSTWYFKGHN